ncbi:unnamed protein product [Blepharisma stoltei]|uniref:Translin-associated factor X-interacting protein 1 N-terminal domain-containing protein n=1 Tax=Blepharisma stoltei TaxID=1481888 RepID=A0AAU9KC82_9CILI|nr:unnamed protein product [Blepharisma stoltei]
MSRLKKPLENLTIDPQNQSFFSGIHHRHSLSNPNSRNSSSSNPHQPKIKFCNILTNKHQSLNRESPYAQNQSISKAYSISNLPKPKEKSRLKSASTLSSHNLSSLIKTNIKVPRNENSQEASFTNLSFYEDWKKKSKEKHSSTDMNLSAANCINLNDQRIDSKDPLLEYARQNREVQSLEFKLTKQLRDQSGKSNSPKMQKEVFDIYSKMFAEIIEKDTLFGPLLLKIQHAYEDWMISATSDYKETSQNLKFELSELSKKCQLQNEDKKTMDRKIEKLSKENYELSKSLEEQEERYAELQEKIFKIADIKIDQLPKDDETWKFLVAENQNYASVCENMRNELKNYAYKEKKLLKLVLAMKKRGYPVEEIYDQEVAHHKKKKKKQEQNQNQIESEEYPDDTENEQLVSERLKYKAKPESIPSLNLKDIQAETLYSSTSSSGSYNDSDSCFIKTQ